MKLISWNVNGLRACVQKGFTDFFREADADIFCVQETKLQEGQIDLETPGYHQYWNYAVKKGYSGTAVFTKEEPLSVSCGIGMEEHDQEGRVITLEYPEFYFVTVYTPNSQNELARLPYRMQWEADFLAYLKKLEEKKIPEDMDYDQVKSLRTEAVQKLKLFRPASIGQAKERISLVGLPWVKSCMACASFPGNRCPGLFLHCLPCNAP